jgi:DNA-binding NtrC family response regulator
MVTAPAPAPASSPSSAPSSSAAPAPSPDADFVSGSLADQEQRHIEQVLRRLNGNRVQAARLLGISVPTLYAKMKKYGLGDVGR